MLLDLLDVFEERVAPVIPAVFELLGRFPKIVLAVRVADRILEDVRAVGRFPELLDYLLQRVSDRLQLGVLDENSIAHGEHLSLVQNLAERGGPASHCPSSGRSALSSGHLLVELLNCLHHALERIAHVADAVGCRIQPVGELGVSVTKLA